MFNVCLTETTDKANISLLACDQFRLKSKKKWWNMFDIIDLTLNTKQFNTLEIIFHKNTQRISIFCYLWFVQPSRVCKVRTFKWVILTLKHTYFSVAYAATLTSCLHGDNDTLNYLQAKKSSIIKWIATELLRKDFTHKLATKSRCLCSGHINNWQESLKKLRNCSIWLSLRYSHSGKWT